MVWVLCDTQSTHYAFIVEKLLMIRYETAVIPFCDDVYFPCGEIYELDAKFF